MGACVPDGVAESVIEMKPSSSKERPPTSLLRPPPPDLGRAQQLPSPLFYTDFCPQLNELLVNMEGMGNRIYVMSVSSQGLKRSAFLHALMCHTLNISGTSPCVLYARL